MPRLQEQAEREQQEKNILKLTEFVTVSELAVMMDVPLIRLSLLV